MLSERLKKETQVHHQKAEQVLLPVFQQLHSKEDYCQLLLCFYRFYCPLEAAILAALPPAQMPALCRSRYTALLLHDLRELDTPAQQLTDPPPVPPLTTAQAWGALYVIEGAALGGQYITKLLLKNTRLQLAPQQVHFFSSQGHDVGSRWQQFLTALNRQTAEDAIVATAQQTFTQFQNHIHEALPVYFYSAAGC